MSRRILFSTKFRKDIKRYTNQPKRLERIRDVIRILESGDEIPKSLRPHKLVSNYSDCLELHIESDLLLIWREQSEEGEIMVYLLRLGSHSDLFK